MEDVAETQNRNQISISNNLTLIYSRIVSAIFAFAKKKEERKEQHQTFTGTFSMFEKATCERTESRKKSNRQSPIEQLKTCGVLANIKLKH